jgi:hypothetical protein
MFAYADTTSVASGSTITFTFSQPCPPGGAAVRITDATTDLTCAEAVADGERWGWNVPAALRSSLYHATIDGVREPVYFVVRGRPGPGSPRILVMVPFLTWQAYNQLGVPGEGLYLSEQPDRAFRVTFDRPGGGPAGFWEDRFYRWLRHAGYAVDFCSGVDLHDGAVRPAAYDLLVSAGHDEYWTWEMRDAVEDFIDRGGNMAFFGGNTCWWQARLEDGGRTLICYRDAYADPMSAVDARRTTVEWHAAPVNRPENAMTGLSFRSGAGCWEKMEVMASVGYRARFAEHWVFAGTGVRDGDEFAMGAVGYETDAAEYAETGGVPLVTGRDGSPASLIILATADLPGWRAYGQGGRATMVVFRRGLGTVFNAGTVNWANRLDDPVVERITRTVLDRLEHRGPAGWEDAGPAEGVVALTAEAAVLFGVTGDGRLLQRPFHGQNLPWSSIQDGTRLRALTCSRESHRGRAVELYGLAEDGWIVFRSPVAGPAPWERLCPAPAAAVALAVVFRGVFAATADGVLWHLDLGDAGERPPGWTACGPAGPVRALAGMSGRLFALGTDGVVRTRPGGAEPASWTDVTRAADAVTLTAHAGRLVTGSAAGRLLLGDVAGHDGQRVP